MQIEDIKKYHALAGKVSFLINMYMKFGRPEPRQLDDLLSNEIAVFAKITQVS